MEELDLLKKNWQKDNSFGQVSEEDIYVMLQKKSSSIVKWIFFVSIVEILLWTVISLFFNTDEYLKSIKHEELDFYFGLLTVFNYAIVLVFIYLFYKNYIAISTTVSIKQLIKDILKTHKTVQLYVWYNLTMVAFSFLFGFYIAFAYNPDITSLLDKIGSNAKVMIITIGVFVVIMAVFMGLFWLFYRLLYGYLLKKLLANFKELQKIDL
jgi:hypothetical protein